MIRHVVLFRRCPDASDRDVDDALAGIVDLQRSIPGILAVSTGANISPEGLQQGMTHGFTVDFVDAAARDAYLIDPLHQAAGARLVSVTDGGVDGLLVLDWETT